MCKRKTIKMIGVALLCGIYSYLPAQCLWHKPDTCRFPVIQNHGFAGETVSVYQRLPQQAKAQVRAEIWNLSTNSAGLAICFTSNAADIQVRYQVSGSDAMPHMPATGVSGCPAPRAVRFWQPRFPAGHGPCRQCSTAYPAPPSG